MRNVKPRPNPKVNGFYLGFFACNGVAEGDVATMQHVTLE